MIEDQIEEWFTDPGISAQIGTFLSSTRPYFWMEAEECVDLGGKAKGMENRFYQLSEDQIEEWIIVTGFFQYLSLSD